MAVTTEAAAATKAVATTKGAGATEGVAATSMAWQSTGSLRRDYLCFFYKFISYVASYIGPIQTSCLMEFLPRLRRNRNHDSCSKRATGMKKTGIRRIPTGIGNPAFTESIFILVLTLGWPKV